MTTVTSTISVPTRFPATLLVEAGEGPSLIFNTDNTNTLYLGDTNAIEAGDLLHTIALSPQSSVNVTGDYNLYGIASGANISVTKLQGATAIAPGTITIIGTVNATVSGSVSITGTPSVTISGTPTVTVSSGSVTVSTPSPIDVSAATVNINSTNNGPSTRLLNDASNHVIAAGGNFETAVINVTNYNSYDIYTTAFAQNQNLAGGAYVIAVAIFWYADTGGTQLIGRETWHIWCSQTAGTLCPAMGSGPIKGAAMKVHYDIAFASSTVTVNNIQVYGSPRMQPRPDWRQFPQNLAAPITPATTWASSNPLANTGLVGSDNVIAEEDSVALAATTTYWLPLPLYAGPVFVRYQGSAALNNQFALNSAAGLTNGVIAAGTSGQVIWTFANDTNDHEATIVAPRAPMFAVVKTTATAPTITFMANGQQL